MTAHLEVLVGVELLVLLVGLVDQLDALRRDVGLARLPQYLAEDGGIVRCYGCGTWVDTPAEACESCQEGGL